jgi:hypothetical protein
METDLKFSVINGNCMTLKWKRQEFGKVKVKLSLCFNWVPHHEGILGSGGIAQLILRPWH